MRSDNWKLVEIKYFQPEEIVRGYTSDLKSRYSHPDRYVYANAWCELRQGISFCQEVGREGWFRFRDNFCPRFLGEYPAIILGEIDQERYMEADRYEEVEP